MSIPFIESNLFGTGHVVIQSAGKQTLWLASLDNPKKIYDYVLNLMRYNGFSLKFHKIVQQESPSQIGVFFEVFRNFFFTLLAVFYFALAFIDEGISLPELLLGSFAWIIYAIIILFLLGLFAKSLLDFLDLERRKYMIYHDGITYSEGFLTKNYAIIPIENLSDSEVTQSIIDRIFGLYDVKLSCQGAGQEILFKNMKNGPQLEKNIDSLISQKKSHPIKETAQAEKHSQYETKQLKPLSGDTRFTAEFRINALRAFMPAIAFTVLFLLSLILIPILSAISGLPKLNLIFGIGIFSFYFIIGGVAYVISTIIKVASTNYYIKAGSVEERFDFIKTKNKEFANQKVMAVIFKENFFDWWLNTASVNFWSIGSSQDIKFLHIKKTQNFSADVLAKFGIGKQEQIYQTNSHFSFGEMLKANPLVAFISVVIFLALIAFGTVNAVFYLLGIIYALIVILSLVYVYFYYKESRLYFFRDYIYFTKGLFFKEHYYVPYNNVKDITTIRYPFSSLGSIVFDIAGERLIQYGENKQLVSNSFRINFVENIQTKDELIDMVFFKRPQDARSVAYIEKNIAKFMPKPIHVSKPALANTMVPVICGLILVNLFLAGPLFTSVILSGTFFAQIGYVFASVSIFIFLLVDILIILLFIISVKVRSYVIQPYRVYSKSGIFFKKQTSIVFNKIDNINSIQRLLNKVFGNGNVTISTTGSSGIELPVRNIKDYQEFYEILKRNYR